jgi:DNA-binding beta-propeller fold protein YncE
MRRPAAAASFGLANLRSINLQEGILMLPRLNLTLSLSLLTVSLLGMQQPAVSQSHEPLTLLNTIRLPGIDGDFDHLAYDLKRNRLIAAAEENHTLEVFDLKTGKHLQSISGFKAPHSIAYVPEDDELFITDGEDASCLILSASDFHRISRIPLRAGADAALYDPATKRYYIGNGGREEKAKASVITIISVTDHRKLADISIDGDNIEAMAVDHAHHRLFVNIRDKKQIGVVHLTSNKVVTTWTTPGMNRNTPMKFDEANQRVFIVGRTPGKFFVFNATSGSLITSMDCVDMADDLTWDSALRRIYVTGSQGISIFHQDSKDTYTQLSQMNTIGGKTSIYVPELKQFYVVHPKAATGNAALLIYRVNP